ncbi:ATP-binding protein [Streptomyces sp. V4I2]|uniref:ATP-binding protein n=1 Tax=Streptomyces sp. V4I2 TaxID=3042280 RepID=UPI0027896DB8|nr:ATP-binding protein [Streptomyces sp. V4I2]MDQ1045115.1 anti-sigma regulatory factor (Ser/Thr protein kinase) [Streptomyces sp. V4I2]
MNAYIPQYRLTLTAGEHSARHIRRIVRSLLDEWELPELSDVVELGVTELVTNVVRHVPDRRCAVLVLRLAGAVRVEVADGVPELPYTRPQLSVEAEGGRGLVLLDAIVDKWGVGPRSEGGKTVWFECGAGEG